MIDPLLNRTLRPLLAKVAHPLAASGIHADQITVAGFFLGLLAVPALALQWYGLALVLILGNRVADGLDGALARLTATSDAGGYIDSVFDFIFYSAIPFGFLLADMEQNAVAAAFLMLTFMGTGATFLAFAAISSKRGIDNPHYPNKSMYYMGGITEGFETILAFIAFCVWPQWFPELAFSFAALCWLTAAIRLWSGYQTLR